MATILYEVIKMELYIDKVYDKDGNEVPIHRQVDSFPALSEFISNLLLQKYIEQNRKTT